MKSALLFAVFMFLIVSAYALIIGIGYECCRGPGQTPPSTPWMNVFAQEWSNRPARAIVLPGHDVADFLAVCGIVFLDLERPEGFLPPGTGSPVIVVTMQNIWPITGASCLLSRDPADQSAPASDTLR